MEILSAESVVSNTKVEKCPQDNLPEYAFIGRSNVGKSSLINMLAKRPKLAMTSSTPGKTLLINHFLINKEWYLVDLPGYGYASRGKKQVEKIQQIIEDYILEREQMTNLFVLIDCRLEPQKIDLEFMEWLGENGVPFSIIFTKADSALLKDGKPFFIPDFMGRIDYETEVVVRICRLGKSIPERFAHRYYDALTVGIDFTARDLQEQLRKNGQPWDLCKGFDGSAVIGQWVDKEKFLNINTLPFHLDINGHTVQEGCTADMLYTIDSLIAYISQYFTLKTGDILFTGTPVGVGPVHIDDHLEGYLADRKVLEFNCK